MIAECICTYAYLNYSKTEKMHIDSRKRLACILLHNSVEASVYIEEYSNVSLNALFGSQYS